MKLSKHQINLFQKLSEMHAISGHENEVASFLASTYLALGYELVKDQLGSIVAYKRSQNPQAKKVLVLAHMDEVGFIVTTINPNGTIKASAVGGLNEQTLLSSRVVLKGRHGYLYGAIGATPPHLLAPSDREKPVSLDHMLFDFGFRNAQEAEEAGVYLGAMIVADEPFRVLNGGARLLGKAFDDRYGIVLGIEMLEAFQNIDLDYDLYIGGSVQEEVGCRGAQTIAHAIHPDLAIILDCSPSRDDRGDVNELGQLGKGVLLRVMDRTMIAFPELIQYQEECAIKAKALAQPYISLGGTDAGVVHKTWDGIPTLTHCLVARNIHTCSSILDVQDYLSAKKSLLYMLKDLTSAKITSLGRGRS